MDYKNYAGALYQINNDVKVEFDESSKEHLNYLDLEVNYQERLSLLPEPIDRGRTNYLWILITVGAVLLATLILVGFYVIYRVRKIRRMAGIVYGRIS